jgi:hypothetical protein
LQFVKVKNSAPVEEHHSITKKNSKIDSTTFAITKNEIVVAPISIQQNTIEINPVESIVKNDVNTTIPNDLKLSKHISFKNKIAAKIIFKSIQRQNKLLVAKKTSIKKNQPIEDENEKLTIDKTEHWGRLSCIFGVIGLLCIILTFVFVFPILLAIGFGIAAFVLGKKSKQTYLGKVGFAFGIIDVLLSIGVIALLVLILLILLVAAAFVAFFNAMFSSGSWD